MHLGGVFVGILWLFCVHFSQFCDLMGIQILHNIRSLMTSCGLYICGQDGRIHFRLSIHIE